MVPVGNLIQLCNRTRTCTAYVGMTDDDLSLASANSDPPKDITAGLNSGAGMDPSTNPTENSEMSLDSVKPKKTMKHLGYCELRRVECSRVDLIYYTFAPGLQFEWNYSRRYPWQPKSGVSTDFENCEIYQLRQHVEELRDWSKLNKAKDSGKPIIAACDHFLELYTEPHHLPSKEDYLASWR
jgi:hypothetical protein